MSSRNAEKTVEEKQCVRWKNLQDYHQRLKSVKLSSFFLGDHAQVAHRTQSLMKSILIDDTNFLKVDLSKNYVTEESLRLYKDYADSINLDEKISKLKSGDKLNTTEGRNVIHTRLRDSNILEYLHTGDRLRLNSVERGIINSLAKIKDLCEKLEFGELRTLANEKFLHIVNIGIGGSDLGPSMVCEALQECASATPTEDISVHFLANIDGNALEDLRQTINFTRTLFIVVSKSLTTIETIRNLQSVQKIMLDSILHRDEMSSAESALIHPKLSRHFILVSSNVAGAKKAGVDTESNFFLEFDEGVGGRYSLWGPVGVSIALKYGLECFMSLLKGANCVDRHFFESNLLNSVPFIMACIEVTYTSFFGWHSRAVVPYNNRLGKLPSYLQQLEMESNGKSITSSGKEIVSCSTCPAVFGGSGTDVQHAFFQLLHQGTEKIPVDFLIALQKGNELDDTHQHWLVANCLAQSQALLLGDLRLRSIDGQITGEYVERKEDELAKAFQGDRPSTTIVVKKITPASLGAIIALYEHKVFVESILWGINAYDQWGVELGKTISKSIFAEITSKGAESTNCHDASTAQLINIYSDNF